MATVSATLFRDECESDAAVSAGVHARGALRQLVGVVQAGPEVLPVLPVRVDRLLLYEGMAVEQLQLSVPGAGCCE